MRSGIPQLMASQSGLVMTFPALFYMKLAMALVFYQTPNMTSFLELDI